MFELPTQNDGDSAANNDSDSNDETTFNGERVSEYEDYWKAISMVRLLKKSCQSLGVAKVKDAGKSPWADHYGHFAAIAYGDDDNKGLKAITSDLPGNLPEYKSEFAAPEGDFDVINAENAEDFGLPADSFAEDEDDIFVPVEYEAPTEVWFQTSGDELSDEEARELIASAPRVGDKTAPGILETLKESGAKLVWE